MRPIDADSIDFYKYNNVYKAIGNTPTLAVVPITTLDKIRTEIDNIEIDGHVRDVECFNMGIRYALNIIDKYKAEMEVEDEDQNNSNRD